MLMPEKYTIKLKIDFMCRGYEKEDVETILKHKISNMWGDEIPYDIVEVKEIVDG